MKKTEKIIRGTKIPWMGRNGKAINPYIGCSHTCEWDNIRCWAWSYASRKGKPFFPPRPVADFIPRLEAELKRIKKPSNVLLSNLCDPYQPLEERCMYTQQAVKLLVEYGWTPIILTKSSLVMRDFYLFEKIGKDKIWVGMTLTAPLIRSHVYSFTAKEGGSPFKQRVATLAKYKGHKWISWEPLPPYIPNAVKFFRQVLDTVKPEYVVFGSLNFAGVPKYNYSSLLMDILKIIEEYQDKISFMIKHEMLRPEFLNTNVQNFLQKYNLLQLTTYAPWLKPKERMFNKTVYNMCPIKTV